MNKASKKIAICGSCAYDTIISINDKFSNHLLKDKLDNLSVAFVSSAMRREFGGCATNIAYNLKLLNIDAVPVATVGKDFTPYLNWLRKHKINTNHIKIYAKDYTAQAFIISDKSNNQITAFHLGAMQHAHNNNVLSVKPNLAIVSPDSKKAMQQHSQNLYNNNIPFIFDPGQAITMFNQKELLKFIDYATWIVVNDYESNILATKTKLSNNEIAHKVVALIITKGSAGSVLYKKNSVIKVPAALPTKIIDPTGCGDSFRAGLIYGLINNLSWEKSLQLANIIASIKIAYVGTQNHKFTLDEINEKLIKEFSVSL